LVNKKFNDSVNKFNDSIIHDPVNDFDNPINDTVTDTFDNTVNKQFDNTINERLDNKVNSVNHKLDEKAITPILPCRIRNADADIEVVNETDIVATANYRSKIKRINLDNLNKGLDNDGLDDDSRSNYFDSFEAFSKTRAKWRKKLNFFKFRRCFCNRSVQPQGQESEEPGINSEFESLVDIGIHPPGASGWGKIKQGKISSFFFPKFERIRLHNLLNVLYNEKSNFGLKTV